MSGFAPFLGRSEGRLGLLLRSRSAQPPDKVGEAKPPYPIGAPMVDATSPSLASSSQEGEGGGYLLSASTPSSDNDSTKSDSNSIHSSDASSLTSASDLLPTAGRPAPPPLFFCWGMQPEWTRHKYHHCLHRWDVEGHERCIPMFTAPVMAGQKGRGGVRAQVQTNSRTL